METMNTLKLKLLNEKLIRANMAMKYAPITSLDDMRNAWCLIGEFNSVLKELTNEELDALLEECKR